MYTTQPLSLPAGLQSLTQLRRLGMICEVVSSGLQLHAFTQLSSLELNFQGHSVLSQCTFPPSLVHLKLKWGRIIAAPSNPTVQLPTQLTSLFIRIGELGVRNPLLELRRLQVDDCKLTATLPALTFLEYVGGRGPFADPSRAQLVNLTSSMIR